MRGLRDPSKFLGLLGELLNLGVDVAAMQETHFICVVTVGYWKAILSFFSVFGSCCSTGVSLLVGCNLNANVNIVFAGDEGQLVVADMAVKTFEFRVVVAYAPNIDGERRG